MNSHHQDGVGELSDPDAAPRLLHHHLRRETHDGSAFQPHSALNVGSSDREDPSVNKKLCSIKGQPKSSVTTDRSHPQVPLRLQIKVSGQRGGLGISIAGGKGSFPYKEHDEGVFISRVTKGGPSEKAGVHVGDRLQEVNGLSMQGATHQEAVSALRNAGSSIRIKVLRERLLSREDAPDVQVYSSRQLSCQDALSQKGKQHQLEGAPNFLSKKIEAVVCNGNGIVDLEKDIKLPEAKKEALKNRDSNLEEKNTMTIPRIILTHPSTSDEDVELLTQSPGREQPFFFDIPDRCVLPECFDNAFYPL